ncbi:MAG: hypothetical protein HYY30_04580 [Chloroflexi bacterium]|nr:hypothetical protein [Chloroflexota bacterium]
MNERIDDLHICVSQLTFLDLLATFVEFREPKYRRVTVHYDHPPRILRGLAKFGGPSPHAVLDLIGLLNRNVRLVAIRHDTAIESYPELQARALETTTDVLLDLLPEIVKDPLFAIWREALEKDPALSLAVKTLAQTAIFPAVLSVMACAAQAPGRSFSFWLPVSWPKIMGMLLIQRVGESADVLAPQTRLRSLVQRVTGLLTALALLFDLATFVLRRGVVLRAPSAKQWKVAAEFIDSKHIAGSPQHADGIVDGHLVQPGDLLLFLTRRQHQNVRRAHGKAAARSAADAAAQRGYHLAVLDGLPFSLSRLRELGQTLWRISALLIDRETSFLAIPVRLCWQDYLDFLNLFIWHRPKHILYLTFPNGVGSFRTNSGLITGLARRHGTTSAGLQSRSTYLRKWEDCFDAFDRYFFWGPQYREALSPMADLFLVQSDYVGSINLDPEMVATVRQDGNRKQAGRVTVLAFSGDVAPHGRDTRHHYTYEYNRAYLELLARFARENPLVTVQMKLKDSIGLDYFREDPRLAWCLDEAELPNFQFLPFERDVYRSALLEADVVSAMGFTSPGVDALLLGKPVVFYSQLGPETSHFTRLPCLVATDERQFHAMLRDAVYDPEAVAAAQREFLRELDPYLDGKAMERVAAALCGDMNVGAATLAASQSCAASARRA